MLSLPNLLTLSRILAVPILVFLLWQPAPIDYAITFVLYCVVGITDYFDGYLARAQGRISRLGQFLDPIADKIMVAAVIMMLVSSPQDERRAGDPRACTSSRRWSSCCARSSSPGLREFLAPLAGVDAGQRARQMEDDAAAGRARGADPRRRGSRRKPWVHNVGLASLWAAAALTLVTGYDYLRTGIQHMDGLIEFPVRSDQV